MDTHFRSFDGLEVSVISSRYQRKSELSREDVRRLIARTKWQYWTVGDPLVSLMEEGICEWTEEGRLVLTSGGIETIEKYIGPAQDSEGL